MANDEHTIAFYRKRLPHWEVSRGVYFVTMRQHGCLPASATNRIKRFAAELRDAEPGEYTTTNLKILSAMEDALDEERNGDLTQPSIASMLMEALDSRCKRGVWDLDAYVLMPNHLHMLFTLETGSLDSVMLDFKRWTGTQANRILGRQGCRFWHREWFDHWSRSESEDQKIREYILDNPVKAGLVKHSAEWPYGSWKT